MAVDAEVISGALDEGGPVLDLALNASTGEIFGSLRRWLALHDSGAALLSYFGPPTGAPSSGVPPVLDFSGSVAAYRSTPCLLGRAGIVVLEVTRPPDHAGDGVSVGLHLAVRTFGDGREEGIRLEGLLRSWERAGRPGVDGLHIDAYPSDAVPAGVRGSVHAGGNMTFVMTTQ